FYPLGSNKQTRSDFRIICATLDNLEVLIKSGKFRFDLFQRISGFTFIQPALRQRKEDIFPLLRNKLNGARKIIFKEEAKVALEAHNWPGNIRELMRLAEILTHSGVGVVRRHEVEEFIQSRQFGQETKCLEDHQYSLIREMGLRNFIE